MTTASQRATGSSVTVTRCGETGSTRGVVEWLFVTVKTYSCSNCITITPPEEMEAMFFRLLLSNNTAVLFCPLYRP